MQSETLTLGDNIVVFLTAVQIGQGRLEVKGNSNSDLDTFTSYSAACGVYTLEQSSPPLRLVDTVFNRRIKWLRNP